MATEPDDCRPVNFPLWFPPLRLPPVVLFDRRETNTSTAGPPTNTTSTNSPALVGWVPPDARRSTWDIILSCLAVFLVCSWKCVHLNVPSAEESRGEWHSVSIWEKREWRLPIFPKRPLLRKWRRKLMWMAIISVAPELGVGMAFMEWERARKDAREVGCSVSLAFLVNMGGLVCRKVRAPTDDATRQAGELPAPTNGADPEKSTTTGTELAGLAHKDCLARIDDLSLNNLAYVPTADDIGDRSKSDTFTKLFAIGQSSWLVVSSIARIYHGYAITELELSTMAFIVCAVAMYGFWWDKPYGIDQRCIMIQVLGPDEYAKVIEDFTQRRLRAHDYTPNLSLNDFWNLAIEGGVDQLLDGLGESLPSTALYLSGMAFSSVHLAAWNWQFPSHLVQVVWRVSATVALVASVFPAITPVIVIAILRPVESLADSRTADLTRNFLGGLILVLGIVAPAIYVAARLAILGLSFYCFTAMPASAYEKVDRTGWIPHFS